MATSKDLQKIESLDDCVREWYARYGEIDDLARPKTVVVALSMFVLPIIAGILAINLCLLAKWTILAALAPLITWYIQMFMGGEEPNEARFLPSVWKFFRENGKDFRALLKQIRAFNEAADVFQREDNLIRSKPERYAEILRQLAGRREHLSEEFRHTMDQLEHVLQPLREARAERRAAKRADSRRRLRKDLKDMERLLPVFEGGKPVGSNVTIDLSAHVAVAELKNQLD